MNTIYDKFREDYNRLWERHSTLAEVPRTDEAVEGNLDGMPCEFTLSSGRQVVEYVPAFTQRTAAGAKVLPSLGVSLQAAAPIVDDNFSFDTPDDGTPSSLYVPKGPVAARYRTDVLELRMQSRPLLERVQAVTTKLPSVQEALVGALISFNAAHAMAVFNVVEAELDDFSTGWKLRAGDASVSLYLFDAADGGNGIAQQVFALWATGGGSGIVFDQVANLLDSTCCERYCERCLLLPRLPEPFVRRGLLDKRLGRVLVHG